MMHFISTPIDATSWLSVVILRFSESTDVRVSSSSRRTSKFDDRSDDETEGIASETAPTIRGYVAITKAALRSVHPDCQLFIKRLHPYL